MIPTQHFRQSPCLSTAIISYTQMNANRSSACAQVPHESRHARLFWSMQNDSIWNPNGGHIRGHYPNKRDAAAEALKIRTTNCSTLPTATVLPRPQIHGCTLHRCWCFLNGSYAHAKPHAMKIQKGSVHDSPKSSAAQKTRDSYGCWRKL